MPMFVITQLQPIAVLFTLPEDNLQAVSQRMAKGTLEVDAYSRDDQTKLATGKLLTIDNQIDQTTGTGRLKAVFDNKDNALWPNQFVNVRLLLEVRKDSTAIPAAAIQRGPQGTYVFVVKSDNTVDVRPVTVAFTQDNVSVIASGLSPSEVVVTDGQDKLQQGSKIEIRPAAPSGSQAAQAAGSEWSGKVFRECSSVQERNESVASVHSPAGGHSPADGGHHAGRHRGLPAASGVGAAGGGLSDHSGDDVLSGRRP